MNPLWRFALYLGGYLMLVPTTLAGLLLATTVYHAHSFRFHEGMLYCVAATDGNGDTRIWGKPGAQTLGWLTIGASEAELARADLRVHEAGHVFQALAIAWAVAIILAPVIALWWGPSALSVNTAVFGGGLLFDLAYGLCFFVPFAKRGFKNWHDAYHDNPFEKHAYKVGDRAKGWGDTPLSR